MTRNPYYTGPASDHFDGLRFFNPDHPSTDHGPRDLLRWQLTGKRVRWGRPLAAIATAMPRPRVDALTVTMVGHASVLIQVAGLNLLVDPVWSGRASPLQWFGPRRFAPPGIAFGDLPPIDAVLITHNHYDHLDLHTLRRLHRGHRPRLIAPLGNDALVARTLPDMPATALDWWQSCQLGPIEITVTPALHWSSRGISDRRMALWGGFHLRGGGYGCYVAGDTGYGNGWPFRQLRERLGAPDLALLPIGAYEPRWFMRPQHMDAAEAVQAMLDCGAAQALGVHWGTFQLTDEGRMEPKELLEAELARRGIAQSRFLALEAGQVWQDDRAGAP